MGQITAPNEEPTHIEIEPFPEVAPTEPSPQVPAKEPA